MLRRCRTPVLAAAIAPWIIFACGSSARRPEPLVAPAWRKPDVHGRACVSCHSPDGLEIAAYAFSDADILRRARSHLSEPEAEQIVAMIHGLRAKYNIEKLLDPMKDRPMQPGGSVLPGETPMERDAAFAASLPAFLPRLFGARIDSVAAARSACDQIMAVDLADLKIGIPCDRISEDEFHGKLHATIADWIPDVPLMAELPADLEDAYLRAPTDQNYATLDAALAALGPRPGTLAHALALNKRRALLLFQHRLRQKLLRRPQSLPFLMGNPLWAIGDFARQYAKVPIDGLGMPPDIAAKKLSGPDSATQMRQLRLSWMWLGWCADPGLQRSSPITETMRADYFAEALWNDGPYPMHEAFMLTRKLATEAFDKTAWGSAPPQHLDLDYTAFLNDKGIAGPLSSSKKHKKLCNTFVANAFRMNLFLLMDELGRTKTVYLRPALVQQIRRMRIVFTDAKDWALADRALALIASCRDGRWRHGQA